MNRTAQVGSISHGTLRTEDLLEAFRFELNYISNVQAHRETLDAVTAFQTAASYYPELYETETASEILECLTNYLEELAPAYCYFGTSEGDGSDFGFWPVMEEIEDLPRVSDPSEVEQHLGEDCAFVNDHGNVTVYSASGAVILELV